MSTRNEDNIYDIYISIILSCKNNTYDNTCCFLIVKLHTAHMEKLLTCSTLLVYGAGLFDINIKNPTYNNTTLKFYVYECKQIQIFNGAL